MRFHLRMEFDFELTLLFTLNLANGLHEGLNMYLYPEVFTIKEKSNL